MDEKVFPKIIEELGTPSYVFDVGLFKERAELVKEAFGEDVGICFSIKANPFLLADLPKVFSKVEVCSPGELTICEKLNVDPSKIIFSGVNKTEKDVCRAMEDEVGIFTVESQLHLDLINEAALKRSKTVPILLRLTGGSQFGIDASEIKRIVRERDRYEGVELKGIHYFTGTQKQKAKTIHRELDKAIELIEEIKTECDFVFEKLEYGTGLAVDYFSDSADESEKERLFSIADKVRETGKKVQLTVEMGRFFAAPCGYYFTKVMDVKTNCDIHYAILDGGMNQLKYDGQIQGMQIPMISHVGNETGDLKKWTLCGSLCTTADVLARDVDIDSLSVGDVLVFKRTGAYSVMEGMAVFLSREMPNVAIYSEDGAIKVVRGLLYTDVFNTPL